MMLRTHISGSVLATVLVVGTIMMLAVLAVVGLWDSDSLFFHKMHRRRQLQAYIESAFLRYARDSVLCGVLAENGSVQLFDDEPDSRVTISVRPWGLYEAVAVTAADAKIHRVKILGRGQGPMADRGLWYKDSGRLLSVAGRCVLQGRLAIPRGKLLYGRVENDGFSASGLSRESLVESGSALPALDESAEKQVEELFALIPDRGTVLPAVVRDMNRDFYGNAPSVVTVGSGILSETVLKGCVILVGDRLVVGNDCRFENTILVGRDIRICDGFSGSLQLFATDTVIVGRNVVLNAPSGIFVHAGNPCRYAELMSGSRVEGYCVIDGDREPDIRTVNYKQDTGATLRGLLYVDATAQLQGKVSGCACLNRSAVHGESGFYQDILYRVELSSDRACVFPNWLKCPYRKRSVKQVY